MSVDDKMVKVGVPRYNDVKKFHSVAVVVCSVILILWTSGLNFPVTKVNDDGFEPPNENEAKLLLNTPKTTAPSRDDAAESITTVSNPTIAYAVTVTSCKKHTLMDGAAVLQHSIYLASKQSRYPNYSIYAFLHPQAIPCRAIYDQLGYRVLIRDVPFSIDQIRGPYKRWANNTGCCGEKEWLKLYSLTLYEHPIVFHFDMDCFVLKPLDDLVDAMLFDKHPQKISRHFMWHNSSHTVPTKPQAFFTRDYGMISRAGQKRVDQIGVQGGFFVVRPSKDVFEEMVELLLRGDYTVANGWGQKGYGQYYGAATIQGFAAYYYAQIRPHSSIELNRCIYNNMVDNPHAKEGGLCLTLERTCEDCRTVPSREIKTAHLTHCLKPWHCAAGNSVRWDTNETRNLCFKLHYEWYRIRHHLETGENISEYHEQVSERRDQAHLIPFDERTFGYCTGWPPKYRPMYPQKIYTATK